MGERRDQAGPGGDSEGGHRQTPLTSPLDALWTRADKAWEAGSLRSAVRLFLAAAKGGDICAQVNLGTFYSNGYGVKPNRALGMYWYRRAYRKGDRLAAHNIGDTYRKENKLRLALAWFERSIKLGDVEGNLDIAKIHLNWGNNAKSIRQLKLVAEAKPLLEVPEASRDEARRILKRLERAPQ